MAQTMLKEEGLPALLENFDRLEDLFHGEARAEEDPSLCFVCLRWASGDEDCRR